MSKLGRNKRPISPPESIAPAVPISPPAVIRVGGYSELWGRDHQFMAAAQGLLDTPLGKPSDRLPPRDDGLDESHKDKAVVLGFHITEQDVEVILVKQRKTGNWGPPHGGLDASFSAEQMIKMNGKPQLTLEQAQAAELLQETGVVVDPEFLATRCDHFDHDKARYHCVIVHFHKKHELKPKDTTEILEARWTTAREAESLLRGGHFAKHFGECLMHAIILLRNEIRIDIQAPFRIISRMADQSRDILIAAIRARNPSRVGTPEFERKLQNYRLRAPVITKRGSSTWFMSELCMPTPVSTRTSIPTPIPVPVPEPTNLVEPTRRFPRTTMHTYQPDTGSVPLGAYPRHGYRPVPPIIQTTCT